MSQLKVNSIVDAAGGSSAVLYGVASPPNSMGFRNRIINGDMRIDQRNAGASVATSSGLSIYSVDRWFGVYSQTSKYTMQQNAGGVTAPAGFKNYLGITSSSAYTVGATELFNLVQGIEGYNIADLNWGTANAAPITISFWVRSSLTGTFGAVVANSAANRFYGFSYTISATNTWEYKTVTVAGDTSGTWATDNTAGVYLRFGLGVGASVSGAAGSWGSTVMWGVTGATSVVGTSGATFYITGVQLEAGTVATPFERRDYGRELMMCQRYYEKSYNTNVTPGTNTNVGFSNSPATGFNTNLWGAMVRFNVTKRATPSISIWSYLGTVGQWHYGVASQTEGLANIIIYAPGMSGFTPYMTSAATGQNTMYGHWAASSEL